MAPLDPTLQAASLALVHFLWQGALLALVAAAALRAARAPATRYAIGVVALGAMLVTPFVTSAWILDRLAPPIAPPPASSMSSSDVSSAEVAALNLAPRLETRVDAAAFASSTPPLASATTEAGVLIVWACGVLLLSGRLAGGWIVARRLARRSIVPARPEIAALARRVAGRLALDRAVRVFESSAIAVPMMVGWLKPVVLLPVAALGGLAPTQLEALIAHELAHVRRHDYLVNLLQSAVETLLFYHPAVWWISRQVRTEREHCCDDLAVTVCDRLVYVSALADLAAMSALAPRPLALAASDGSLLARVRRLLGGAHEPRSSNAIWALGVAALVVVVGGAQVGPWAQRPVSAAPLRQNPVATTAAVASFGRETSQRQQTQQTPQTPAVPVVPSVMVAPDPPPVPALPIAASQAAPQTPATPVTPATPQVLATQASEALVAAQAKLAKAMEEQIASQKPVIDPEVMKGRLDTMLKSLRELDQTLAKRPLATEAQRLQREQLDEIVAKVKTLLAERATADAKLRASLDQRKLATVEADRAQMVLETKAALEKLQAAQGATLKGGGTHDSSGLYVWSEDGHRVSVRWSGPFKLADDDKDVAWVEAGKTVEVADGMWMLGTGVQITAAADGAITRAYRRNGVDGAFDPDGKAYLAGALGQLIANTGFAADMRVARILRTGGVDAVLKEIDGLKTDSARHAYYVELIHQANLSPADLARIGKKASETIKSSPDLTAVLMSSAQSARGDDAALVALAGATAKIADDHDRHRALTAVLPVRPSGALATAVLDGAAGLRSDDDRSELLVEALKKDAVTADSKAAFLTAVNGIKSIDERNRVLALSAKDPLFADLAVKKAMLASSASSNEAVDAQDIFSRVAALPTDRDRADALVAILKGRTLTPAQRKMYVEAAEGIRSDYDQNRALAALVGAEGGK